MKKQWLDLDHQVRSQLRGLGLSPKEYIALVGLSGGADSLALVLCLHKLGFQLLVHFCHHGDDQNKDFRDQSLEFCQNFCEKHKIEFSFEKSSESLTSEEQLREFRRQSLARRRDVIRQKLTRGYCLLALGHHQNDLLETQLMRLIRGVGHQGLASMLPLTSQGILRPFLKHSKQELIQYLKAQGQDWMEDPSNLDQGPMRNWIRQSWLPSLEAKQPGASLALARSLGLLVEEWSSHAEFSPFEKAYEPESRSVSHVLYCSFSAEKQQQLVAEWVFTLGIRDFSQGKIKEVQKRLDSLEKEHTFSVGGITWMVNAGQIKVGS